MNPTPARPPLAGRDGRRPAIGLVGAGAVSVQFGAAFATRLFAHVGPPGAAALRLAIAAVILSVAARGTRRRGPARTGGERAPGNHPGPKRAGTGRDRAPSNRAGTGRDRAANNRAGPKQAGCRRANPPGAPGPNRPGPRPQPGGTADRAVAACFGLVLAAMNLSFYEAIARIPLGVAVTIEFSGPLCLALAGSRRLLDGLWAVAAGAGIALLASGTGHHFDPVGLVFALVAGGFWVGYILLSKEVGRRLPALDGLAWAMTVGGVALLPYGIASGGSRLLHPAVLVLGLVVAVLSSVVPYTLELLALRRVSARAFGVMISLDPALAGAAGFVVLGQHLDPTEWIALGLVVVANLGNALTGGAAAETVLA